MPESETDGWPETFRGREPGREPYRFTVENVRTLERIGVLGDKGGSFELIEGLLLMRSSDVPIRLHSSDLAVLYEAGVIPRHVRAEMVDGVVYLADDDAGRLKSADDGNPVGLAAA